MTIHTILILSVFYVINFFDLVVRSTSSGLPFIIIFIFINYVIFICRSQFEDHILSLYHIHINKYLASHPMTFLVLFVISRFDEDKFAHHSQLCFSTLMWRLCRDGTSISPVISTIILSLEYL